MNDCIFCKIARDEAKAEKLFETEKSVAFLDIQPRSPGHTLVIPKKHVVTITDLEDEDIAEVFKTTRAVVQILKKALDPDGFNIGINDGRFAGQDVMHLHVNIFPRYAGDGGKSIHSIVYNPLSEDISETAARIRTSANL